MKIARAFLFICLAMVVAGFSVMAQAQTQDRLRGSDGDTIVVQGHDAAARTADLCKDLHAGRNTSRGPRERYPDWLKTLICNYLVFDFRTARVRNAYIRDVLTQFRIHGTGDWKFQNGDLINHQHADSINHIVTDQPAYLAQELGGLRPTMIKTASLQRSLRDPSKAAFGMVASSFAVPPLKAGADGTARLARIAQAETMIQRVLVYALVADQLAGTTAALSQNAVRSHFMAGLTAFHEIMTEKALPDKRDFELTFGPRPAAPSSVADPAYKRPVVSAVKKVIVLQINPNYSPVRIAKLTGTRALGLTVPAATLESNGARITPLAVHPERLESIEPRPRFEPQYVVSIAVRTRFAALIYPGAVPASKATRVIKSLRGITHREFATRVIGVGGKECTPEIQKHEQHHADDQWDEWQAKVVESIENDMEKLDFKNLLSKKITIDASQKEDIGDSDSVHFLIIKGQYNFGKGHRSSARRAQSKLNSRFKYALKKYSDRFDAGYKQKGIAFHKKWKGIDKNCQPTTDAGKVVVKFGSYGK